MLLHLFECCLILIFAPLHSIHVRNIVTAKVLFMVDDSHP
jgi:hypothetical protein